MLMIEKDCDGRVTRLQVSGRIESHQIAGIQAELNDNCTHKIVDLSEVNLVDLEAIRFLIRCEDDGVELVQCPSYVREWMVRERAVAGRLASGKAV